MVAEDKLPPKWPRGRGTKGDPSAEGRVTPCPVQGGGCKIISFCFDLHIKGRVRNCVRLVLTQQGLHGLVQEETR